MQTDNKENLTEETESTATPEMLRREFIKRFGVYAAGSAVGLYLLMSPKSSKAAGVSSDGATG